MLRDARTHARAGSGMTDDDRGDLGDAGWRSSLRVTYGAVLGLMVAVTAFCLITLSAFNARENVLDVSEVILEQVTEVTYQRVRAFVDEPRIVNRTTLRDLNNGLLSLDDPDAMEIYFFDTLLVHDGVQLMYYADSDGQFVMVKRQADGSLDTKTILNEVVDPDAELIEGQEPERARVVRWVHRTPGDRLDNIREELVVADDDYDPRTRPWYQGASDSEKMYWTDAYIFFTDKAPGITVAMPHRRDGKLIGVASIDIGLDLFSSFLNNLSIGDRGQAFILDHRGRIIASPDATDLVLEKVTDDGTELVLHKVDEAHFQPLVDMSRLTAFRKAMDSTGDTTLRKMHWTSEGEAWLGAVRPIRVGGGSEWLIVTLAPEDDFLNDVKYHNRMNVVLALGFLALALIISWGLSRWLSSSLQVLVAESQRIADLDFTPRARIDSRFKEIHDVLRAFDDMKVGLRAFQKYMPLKLVRHLLENHEVPKLESENQIVTLWFSDIGGFSAVSERLQPQQMAIVLGGYLSSLTGIINDHEGTVVQYVGDEIMALFNAPVPVDDHPQKAAEAAVTCRDLIHSMYDGEDGTVPLPTRFALHTTEVAVGHFGSSERLYYGAVGDGVNLTSRLEGANKHYGTEIIISGTVADQITGFELRKLDSIIVKGRQGAIDIYELMGRTGDVAQELLDARAHYERALDLYGQLEWDAAIHECNLALRIHKGDKAARNLRSRCFKYKKRGEVETGWTAAFKMETK